MKRNETIPRADQGIIEQEIMDRIAAIQKLFHRLKMIDGSRIVPVLKKDGLSNEYKTRIRKYLLNKHSYRQAIALGHRASDGPRGISYSLKITEPPTPELARNIYLGVPAGEEPSPHLSVLNILKKNKAIRFVRQPNRLVVYFK